MGIRVQFALDITPANRDARCFKLAVVADDFAKVTDTASWPSGVMIRAWNYKRETRLVSETHDGDQHDDERRSEIVFSNVDMEPTVGDIDAVVAVSQLAVTDQGAGKGGSSLTGAAMSDAATGGASTSDSTMGGMTELTSKTSMDCAVASAMSLTMMSTDVVSEQGLNVNG